MPTTTIEPQVELKAIQREPGMTFVIVTRDQAEALIGRTGSYAIRPVVPAPPDDAVRPLTATKE